VKRVLLVDDEDNIRRLLKAVLRTGGFEVHEAATASAALALIESNRFDVLVTDILLDDMDGPSLAHAAVAKDPSLLVVFISGQPFDLEAERRRHPYCAFLTKPFPPKLLLKTIHELEEHRTARD
jgi:two-component system cell cycle sensor histidine kinase/response regulator CckA